jgi:hypothetical protein
VELERRELPRRAAERREADADSDRCEVATEREGRDVLAALAPRVAVVAAERRDIALPTRAPERREVALPSRAPERRDAERRAVVPLRRLLALRRPRFDAFRPPPFDAFRPPPFDAFRPPPFDAFFRPFAAFFRPPFFSLATVMLSTRFGYGRPAFFARFFASALSPAVSVVCFDFRGAGFSQGVRADFRFELFFAAMTNS